MLPDWIKDSVSWLALVTSLVVIITLLTKFVIKQYNDRRVDKKDLKEENALILANERAKNAELAVAQKNELYEKFLNEYKELSEKYLENSKSLISAVEGNKLTNISMETALNQLGHINEKLTTSVDKLRDSITDNLIKITK